MLRRDFFNGIDHTTDKFITFLAVIPPSMLESLTDDTILPDSCTPVGVCDICDSDADCSEGLSCVECFDGLDNGFLDNNLNDFECTGVVDRCAPFSFFFVECEDGFF